MNIRDDAFKVKLKIEQAFSNIRYPGDNNITTHRCYECDRISEYFRGKNWKDVSMIDFYTSYIKTCLTLLSDDAFRFYLPLFLTASLEVPDHNESLSSRSTDTRASIIFNLEPPNPITRNRINQEKHMPVQWEEQVHRWHARIGGLNAEQKEAIEYFLRFLKKNTFEENKNLDRALAFFSQEQSKQDSE